jgi:SAM-dependent methyltransferase
MVSFTCNICGAQNTVQTVEWEEPSCSGCGSNVRMRALIYLLSWELFGAEVLLPDFPQRRDITGIGLSDDLLYAVPLAQKLAYTNTFYDRQPYLDITEAQPERYGKLDFILSSDVFEHVAPPIERAFEQACRMLKPSGFMCITVPSSSVDETTIEHYPDLHEYRIVELGGEPVLINRKKDKTLEIYGSLEFHGGIGATLVMRVFAQKDLAQKLRAAGFSEVVFQAEEVPRFGIFFDGPWGRPLVARKQRFTLGPEPPREPGREEVNPAPPVVRDAAQSATDALEAQILRLHNERSALERRVTALEAQAHAVAGSRWMKLGRVFGLGPKLR